jgi:hypothetical protein
MHNLAAGCLRLNSSRARSARDENVKKEICVERFEGPTQENGG